MSMTRDELIKRAQHLAFNGDDETTRTLAREVDRWNCDATRFPHDPGVSMMLRVALANFQEHLASVNAAAEVGVD